MSDYGAPPPPPGGGGYAAPPPGGAAPVNHPRGMLILILGIVSLVCLQILGPVAWIMGNTAIREIDANPGAYSNRSLVQVGRICGIIATVLLVLGVVVWIVLFATGMMSASDGGY